MIDQIGIAVLVVLGLFMVGLTVWQQWRHGR